METVVIGKRSVKCVNVNTAVLGVGAAGLNAANWLYRYGQNDVCLVCESMQNSTSRNTGSDKQTYYKLTLAGGEGDSVMEMARTLFDGQCVDGDIALVEAAMSMPCFMNLVNLGVPFPANRYGEYIGYKTDHDPRKRATSAGPLTSRIMTECLERSVRQKNIPVYEHCQAVSVIVRDKSVRGLLCLYTKYGDNPEFILFNCKNLVFAAGGPAGMYADSAYPFGHYGATGLALAAGAAGKNLTEWQYGLSSVAPRWNVSGTYMQVLPRFISTQPDGGDEREFLSGYFPDVGELLSKVFLKGYQWPFDVRKVKDGSSIIDILVYIETRMKGRRVFLDYTKNPAGNAFCFSSLNEEAYRYLEHSGALFGTPVERLLHMNAPAYGFFFDRGIDLKKELLEISLCAQHNNGGLGIDLWWQTDIEGLFAVGEAAASHGVYRPGGSALNAGQVGSMRAAQFIAQRRRGTPLPPDETGPAAEAVENAFSLMEKALGEQDTAGARLAHAQRRMSSVGGPMRNVEEIEQALREIEHEREHFEDTVRVTSPSRIGMVFRLLETLNCQYAYLSAMLDYVKKGGKSRGSALYTDAAGEEPILGLSKKFRYVLDKGGLADMVQEVSLKNGKCSFAWRPVRSIPQEDGFFENVWKSYRENKNVF